MNDEAAAPASLSKGIEGQRQFCISDIHGCSSTFQALLDKIGLSKDDHLFLLGDYIDRGPDSKGVLDIIIKLMNDGFNVHPLRGNHEQMLLDALTDRRAEMLFLQNAGGRTLQSFGVKRAADVPGIYIDFVRQTALYMEIGNWLLVHAGFNFGADDIFADTEAMLWIRDFDVSRRKLGNRRMVHGHSPWPIEQIQRQVSTGKPPASINIDAGCVYDREWSALCALELTEMKLESVRPKE